MSENPESEVETEVDPEFLRDLAGLMNRANRLVKDVKQLSEDATTSRLSESGQLFYRQRNDELTPREKVLVGVYRPWSDAIEALTAACESLRP